jgi:putative endonuclease
MDKYCVYIIKCSNFSYYVGHTNDLDRRLNEHSVGKGSYHTKLHRPFELVYVVWYQNRNDAFWVERKIKAWSRKKKEALIAQNWGNLSKYSKKKF